MPPHRCFGCGRPTAALGFGLSNGGALGSERLRGAPLGSSYEERRLGREGERGGAAVRSRALAQQTLTSVSHMSPGRPPRLSSWDLPQPPKEGDAQGSPLLPELGRQGMFWLDTLGDLLHRWRGLKGCCPMGHCLDRDREWQQWGREGDWRGRRSFPPALFCSSYHSMLRDLGRKADSSAEAYSAFLLFSCFCLTDKRWANLERLLSDLGKGRGKALMSLKHPDSQQQVRGTKPGDAQS